MTFLRTTFLTLASALALTAADGTGLAAIYYSGADFSGTTQTRTDATLNFDWGQSGPGLPGIGRDYFSVLWKGQLAPTRTETYTIYTTSDDGIMLSINGKVMIVNWQPHGPTENSATIAMVAGQRYDVVVKYYQNRGGAQARLSWSSPSTPKAIIPQSCLWPTAGASATPLAISSDPASRTSPAWLAGTVPEGAEALTIQAGSAAAAVTRERAGAWFASTATAAQPLGIPLPLTGSVPVTVTSRTGTATTSVTQALAWTLTDLTHLPYGMDNLFIRPGDSLLLAASGSGTRIEIDPDFDGTTFHAVHSGTSASRFASLFTRIGTHDVRARRDGVEVGKLKVVVVGVDLQGPIADEVAFQRIKDVGITPASAGDEVVFTSNDSEWLFVTQSSPLPTGVRLNLLPLTGGNRVLEARLGASDGPIICQRKLDTFTLATDAALFINIIQTYPDGSKLAEAKLLMSPLVRDLTVTLSTFVSGVTFDDSTTRRVISSNAFIAAAGNGTYTYRLLRSPGGHDHWCHTFVVTQGGVTISR